jgi:hypothetical protein
VLAAQDIAEALDGEMQIHNDVSLTGSVGQRLSKEKSWINEPRVRLSKTVLLIMKHLREFGVWARVDSINEPAIAEPNYFL